MKKNTAIASHPVPIRTEITAEPRIEGSPIEKSIRWLAIVMATAIFCTLAWPMFHREIFAYGDLKNSFGPMRFSYSEALKSGDNFLWEPKVYCGSYLYALGESSMCHPLNLLLYRTLPFDVAFNVEFIFDYFWLFLGTFLLFWCWRIPCGVAVFGAIVFTFGGTNLLHFVHLARFGTVRSMPWVILLADIVMCSPSWRNVVLAQLGVSLLTASALIGGSSHYFIYTMFAQGGCVLWRLMSGHDFRRAVLLGVAVILGVAISAVQVIPSLEGVASMGRSHDPLFPLIMSLHPANLLQLCSPYLFRDRFCSYSHDPMEGNTHEMGLYCTAFCTVALAWLWMRRRALHQHRLFIRGVFFFGVGAMILAFGKYGVAYALLAELPLLNKFRCSCRYILLVQLAMTILASVALADMLKVARDKVKIPWREQWPLMVPLGISVLTFLGASWFLLTPHPGHPYATQLSSVQEAFIGLAAIAAAVALCVISARGMKLGVFGIILLTFLEICTAGLWQHLWRHGQPVTVDNLIASVSKPPSKDGRVLSYRYDNLLQMAGYDEMQGYVHAPVLRLFPRVLGFSTTKDEYGKERLAISPHGLKALQLAGVKWLDPSPPEAKATNVPWIEFPSPLPRVRLVAHAVVSADEATMFATIDPATTAIIDKPIGETVGPPGTLRLAVNRPGLVEIDTETPGRQVLVWAESYNSGWAVTINGQPAAPLCAYGDFMGCAVPAGKCHVVLRFEPASFARGLQITVAALFAAFAFAGCLCIPVQGRPRRTAVEWLLSMNRCEEGTGHVDSDRKHTGGSRHHNSK